MRDERFNDQGKHRAKAGPLYDKQTAIDTERGRRLYSQRIGAVEPVYGNLRHNRRLARLNPREREKVNAQCHLVMHGAQH